MTGIAAIECERICAIRAARTISSETGKPFAQAQCEWGLSIDQFRWYAQGAKKRSGATQPCPAFANFVGTATFSAVSRSASS